MPPVLAAAYKFEQFAEDLLTKVHTLFGSPCDTLKAYLSDAAPDLAADAVKADLAEIASTDSGFTAGGWDLAAEGTRAGGVVTVVGDSILIEAQDDGIGPFRYVNIYNDDPAGDPLICGWDHGEEVTLVAGETFAIRFDEEVVTGTVLTFQ